MSIHDRFPNGMTLKKIERTQISVAGEQFQFQTLITEKCVNELNERVAVFVARRLSNNDIVILKLRVQSVYLSIFKYHIVEGHVLFANGENYSFARMNPLLIEPAEDRNGVVKWATRVFRRECQAIGACERATPYAPRLYGYAQLVQDDTYEFPGGYLHALAMSRVPGSPVPEINGLTDDERSVIKAQLLQILE
jgi:hypothetical protein